MKKLFLLLFIPIVFSCSSDSADEDNEPCPSQPEITTNEATNINYDQNNDYFTATLSGEISNIPLGANCETYSVTNQGFVYDTNTQPTTEDNVVDANGQNVSTNINGLISDTTYYVRAYLTNTLGTFYGNQVIFETSDTPDLVAPVITIIGDNPLELNIYDDYEEFGATAIDNIDGDISQNIQINSNVNNQVEGSYDVVYSVSDSSGNSSSETRVVNVIANPVYLDENGITIKAYDWAEIGDIGVINGVSYTIIESYTGSSWSTEQICTTRVTNMQTLFMNTYGGTSMDISSWDTSNVTNMRGMFYMFQTHNGNIDDTAPVYQDISNWDTSNVTDMSYMFKGTNQNTTQAWNPFNGDISNWDVSSVTDMSEMFMHSQFQGDLSNWDVSNVTNMDFMFNASGFNSEMGALDNWDVGNVISMRGTFRYASIMIYTDLSNWDVSNVTRMDGMFQLSGGSSDISNWDVSSVTNMFSMFQGASLFNADLSSWDVSNVTQCDEFCDTGTDNWTLPKPNFTNCENSGCN